MSKWKNLNKETRQSILERSGYIAKNGNAKHRIEYRKCWGPIPIGWVIHHIDADKKNNRPINLIAMPAKLHNEIHSWPFLPTREEIKTELRYYIKYMPNRLKNKNAIKSIISVIS